jgi:RNA polymerase sigma factor for flagellar operon FliA
MGLMNAPTGEAARQRIPGATDRLWQDFVRARDPALRAQLAAAYLGFARVMAAKAYARRTCAGVEFADYLQYARVGLLEAIDRFEPERGNKFETYAAARITGAVLSGIESSSEIQQQVAARRRIMAQRLAALDEPGQEDGAPHAVFARLAELAIGLAVGFALEGSGMHRAEDAGYEDNGYRGLELRQLRAQVLALVDELPDRQRHVIHAHYLQNVEFAEIAASLALSRGRIAQLHKEALGSLRARLQHRGGIDLDC